MSEVLGSQAKGRSTDASQQPAAPQADQEPAGLQSEQQVPPKRACSCLHHMMCAVNLKLYGGCTHMHEGHMQMPLQ